MGRFGNVKKKKEKRKFRSGFLLNCMWNNMLMPWTTTIYIYNYELIGAIQR